MFFFFTELSLKHCFIHIGYMWCCLRIWPTEGFLRYTFALEAQNCGLHMYLQRLLEEHCLSKWQETEMLVVYWGSCQCNLLSQPLRTIYSILRSRTCWNACLWVKFWCWTLCKTCKQAQLHFNKWSNTHNGVRTGCMALSAFPFITAFNHTVKISPPLRIKTKSPQAWTD